jgi:hypothetical protein
MANDQRPDRPDDAGDRNRDNRLRAWRQRARQERWDVPEIEGRRAHRRSRTRRSR